MNERFDLVVVGGGVIGLACAWRAAQRGLRIAVLDAAEPGNASHAAAGMLAPASELGENSRALTELSRASLAEYPDFVAELEEVSGTAVAFRVCGSLQVALDGEERRALEQLHQLQQDDGLETELLDAAACRAREPGLATDIETGIWSAAEGQVDPRALVRALRLACTRHAVRLERTRVEGADLHSGRLVAVETSAGRFAADRFLLAGGARSGEQPWLPQEHRPPVEPVKGELLRGRLPMPPARALVRGSDAYVVARPDGRIVIGASSEHAGFDATPSPSVRELLLAEGSRLLPALEAVTELEHCVGFRPGTPDGLPLIGETDLEGLLLATGHYRNGVLLAPVTAIAIAALLIGEPPPLVVTAAAPSRFASLSR
jgi:glycine oxidase